MEPIQLGALLCYCGLWYSLGIFMGFYLSGWPNEGDYGDKNDSLN